MRLKVRKLFTNNFESLTNNQQSDWHSPVTQCSPEVPMPPSDSARRLYRLRLLIRVRILEPRGQVLRTSWENCSSRSQCSSGKREFGGKLCASTVWIPFGISQPRLFGQKPVAVVVYHSVRRQKVMTNEISFEFARGSHQFASAFARLACNRRKVPRDSGCISFGVFYKSL